ncbi:ATP-dependent 6-phosphofructokinase, partial [bacterium]|nr:ATP-dependent 6-phosphofructokinase [bacterium]
MHLSHEMGDFAPNFVGDDERIIYAHRLSTIKETMDRGLEPYSFEAAGPRNRIYFNPKESRAAIVTCGGLCPGINDVIRGLVYGLKHHYGVNTIYGIRYGYKGLVEESELEPIQLTTEKVEYIINQGGTYLGSSRGPQSVEAMIDFMQRRGINMLFTIGGDGTQRGALELAKEAGRRNLDIAIVGIPKTIDNDVRFVEKSFGFESAYSTATQVLQTAHAEAIGAFNGIAIVKLMGRHSGCIAANASVASGEANFTLVPEIPFDLD